MAGPAAIPFHYLKHLILYRSLKIPIHIVSCIDACCLVLHGKANVNMANPAGKLRPVEPVIKNNRYYTGLFGIIIQIYSPKVFRRRNFIDIFTE